MKSTPSGKQSRFHFILVTEPLEGQDVTQDVSSRLKTKTNDQMVHDRANNIPLPTLFISR